MSRRALLLPLLLTEVADVVLLLLLLPLFRRVEVTWELGRARDRLGVIKGLRVGQSWRCVVVTISHM